MAEIVEAIGTWPGALLLRRSGTAYLFVNAAHILGIGLLIGAILPLDLRLLGCFRSVPVMVIGPFLSRMAAIGLALALLTGGWLFSVRPAEYLGNTAFLCKLGLLALALIDIAAQHGSRGFRHAVAGGPIGRGVRALAFTSASLWIATLLAGRWIGFL